MKEVKTTLSFPTSLRSVEIEQQIKLGFTSDVIEKFIADMPTKRYLYIEHGRNILDSDGLPIEDKEPHNHLYIWFSMPVNTKNIISKLVKLGCTADIQQLEKIKKDDSAIAYATHENCDKPKYPRNNVHANFEIDEIINKEVERKKARHNPERANEILDMIDKGELKEYNIYQKLSIVEYNTYKRDIDNGFKFRVLKLRSEVNRNMQCIYICGDSGSGKTTYAKEICSQRKLDYFISSSSNDVLDGYAGQPAIILDDLRPSSMGLADLLKMLDNNTSSSVKSRYANKVLECQLIVVTSVLDIDVFFSKVFSEQPETIVQLKRRCSLMIRMTHDYIENFLYDAKTKDYVSLGRTENYVLMSINAPQLSEDEMYYKACQILGTSADMMKKAVKIFKDNKPEYMQMSIDDMELKKELPF